MKPTNEQVEIGAAALWRHDWITHVGGEPPYPWGHEHWEDGMNGAAMDDDRARVRSVLEAIEQPSLEDVLPYGWAVRELRKEGDAWYAYVENDIPTDMEGWGEATASTIDAAIRNAITAAKDAS